MAVILVIGFLVIFAVVLLAIGLGWRWIESQRKGEVSKILRNASGERLAEVTILRDQPAGGGFSRMFAELPVYSAIQTRIEQAGVSWSPEGFGLAVVIAAGIGALLGSILPFPFARWLLVLSMAAVLGALPYFWLNIKRNGRLKDFEDQFPEALDFLSRSMRAGHAFSISLEMLADEAMPPLAMEFRRVFNEQNLGGSIESALKNLAARVPLVDVRFFVSAVLLQRETGGNLSEILIKLAYVIRERFRLKGQVRAASAHGRVTGVVLTLMPVALTIALLFVAPGYIQSMVNDPDGKYLIGGAILAQFLGYYFIHRIIDIKV